MGVYLKNRQYHFGEISFPHIRGGVPCETVQEADYINAFPTYVGVYRDDLSKYDGALSYPHIRGGVMIFGECFAVQFWFSPYMSEFIWGLL